MHGARTGTLIWCMSSGFAPWLGVSIGRLRRTQREPGPWRDESGGPSRACPPEENSEAKMLQTHPYSPRLCGGPPGVHGVLPFGFCARGAWHQTDCLYERISQDRPSRWYDKSLVKTTTKLIRNAEEIIACLEKCTPLLGSCQEPDAARLTCMGDHDGGTCLLSCQLLRNRKSSLGSSTLGLPQKVVCVHGTPARGEIHTKQRELSR